MADIGISVLRSDGRSALNERFRSGWPPDPALDGRTSGELLHLEIAPGVSQLLGALLATRMPWQGKTFDATTSRGDNIFTRGSLRLARLFSPGYRGFRGDGTTTYRAYAFRTYIAAGREDPDREVLKIDYDLPENPRLTVRRVLDELVQVGDGTYLGKAHVKWWWGRWQRVAFFALMDESRNS
jgi:hypothetical protein